MGALSCKTVGSLENILSALSHRSAISLQSRKNCLRTGGFQPRGFSSDAITFLGTLLIDICRSSNFLAAVAFSGVP
uniref:Uncharacterized protein n=1 Tax=Arundo donax TaxID=35708 RepID=A0A0A9DU85_ARUDO